MDVQIDGQATSFSDDEICAQVFQRVLSGKKFKSLVAAKCQIQDSPDSIRTEILDLSAHIPANCVSLSSVYIDSPEGLAILRHSTAHIMAAAVKKLFPSVKIAIGPAIENGFYYDFDLDKPLGAENFEAIENEMRKIVEADLPFMRSDASKSDALQSFANDPYKMELITAIPAETVGLYTCGDFTDLCKGPHIPRTGFAHDFKLLSTAGAYWRGDEKNKMLSRIYGTAFASKKELDSYLKMLEEAKLRDHRKLGRELEYFDFEEEVAPGMVFWLPAGMLIRAILEDFWRREHLKRGYELVQGPQLLRVETWQKSGHYDHYRENMYFTEIDKDHYGIKPMNCIGHMLIYRHNLHSYRDLPIRFFELGVVHRHEKSGVLHGLMRVRQFTQDDAHIICTPEQLQDEILGVIRLVRDLMCLFDFKFKVFISTRPEKSIGSDEAWEMATQALIKAVENAGIPYEINEGDGAFYGPKIDVNLLDSLGRQWQCSTIQVDFTLPERFDLTYIGSDGEKHRPVMVHRAIMGSVERFIGVLLEHYAGALPVWLAPVQARILTVTDAAEEAAKRMACELQTAGIRVKLDTRNEKLGFKVREAQLAKIQYILVAGEKEVQANALSVRLRNGDNLGLKSTAEIVSLIKNESEKPFKQGGMSYSFD